VNSDLIGNNNGCSSSRLSNLSRGKKTLARASIVYN